METFEQLAALASDHARDLIEDGAQPDDVSGAFLSAAVSLLIVTEGRSATSAYLTDLAARIAVEANHG